MGTWGGGHFCCYSFLLVFVHLRVGWGPGRDFAPPRKDHTPFASPFRFVAFPLQSSTFYFATFTFYFLSFAMSCLSDAGEEGDWMSRHLSAVITRLTCFDTPYASTSSDYFISAHNDVQV
jgi:hypothetical protein